MSALRKEEYLPCYSYDDYLLWEGNWELIDGIPYAMAPSPMKNHQMIASNFIFELRTNMNKCEKCLVLGELDWKLDNNSVVRPDVVLICDDFKENYITKAPKIVVEIISKSTAKQDENIKFELYEKEKVKYYILAYPDKSKAIIYKLKNGTYEKQGEFKSEKFQFNDECSVEIDFNNIFKRFRK